MRRAIIWSSLLFGFLIPSAFSQESKDVLEDISELEQRLNEYATEQTVTGPTLVELEDSLKKSETKIAELTDKLKACEEKTDD